MLAQLIQQVLMETKNHLDFGQSMIVEGMIVKRLLMDGLQLL
jgi:1,2-phenylacetyl-CoA epoxidase catalytic subunit